MLHGDPFPPQQQEGAKPPPQNFQPMFVAKRLDGSRCHLVRRYRLSPGDCVRWGPSPLPRKGVELPPNFRPTCIVAKRLWMHQDATWYGGRPQPTRHCVRRGPSYPKKKGTLTPPNFGPYLFWPNGGWMKTPFCTEVDLGPGRIVLDGVPAPAKGAQQPSSFRPMSFVATVAHLSYC